MESSSLTSPVDRICPQWCHLNICEKCPYGQHILLTCSNHPNKKWNTKNISHIGARSIFYKGTFDPSMGQECDCDIELLKHVHVDVYVNPDISTK